MVVSFALHFSSTEWILLIVSLYYSLTGTRQWDNYYILIKRLQNINVFCYGEESRIFDCAYANSSGSCYNYFKVGCREG